MEKRTGIANLSAVVNAQSSDYSSRALTDSFGVLSRFDQDSDRDAPDVGRDRPGDFK